MASVVLEALAVGNYDAWSNFGGANKMASVALPDDDSSTYIEVELATSRQSFTLDALPSNARAIENVDVKFRAEGEVDPDAGKMIHFLRLGGTDLDSAEHAFGTSWSEFTWTNVGRPGGGAWTLADFTTVEVGVKKTVDTSGGSRSGRLTTIEVLVTFTAAAGGWNWLIG